MILEKECVRNALLKLFMQQEPYYSVYLTSASFFCAVLHISRSSFRLLLHIFFKNTPHANHSIRFSAKIKTQHRSFQSAAKELSLLAACPPSQARESIMEQCVLRVHWSGVRGESSRHTLRWL